MMDDAFYSPRFRRSLLFFVYVVRYDRCRGEKRILVVLQTRESEVLYTKFQLYPRKTLTLPGGMG